VESIEPTWHREGEQLMNRFASSDYGNGRRPIYFRPFGGNTPAAATPEGRTGGREFSRAEMMRLLGGGLAAATLLPGGLARMAPAAALTSTYQASVKRALASQTDLIDDREHCSADPERLETIGRAVGHQVRIKRGSSEYALYTVSEPRQESPDNIVRMGLSGRQRLSTSDEFGATLSAQVPNPVLTEAEAKERSEFVERLADNGTHRGLIAIAPHGGQIEPYTDRQAERVAEQLSAKGVSSWRCKGWKQGGGAHERWHITSTDIHPASFPKLNRVISRGFRYAVAFHGFGGTGVLIGGAAPDSLKGEIKLAIERAVTGSGIAVRLAQPDDNLGGSSSRNIVNRLTAGGAGGIQIEQSLSAREGHGQTIADAVASVYRSRLA
jgi:phage replication-related protein YjqB (UPF0714/DUF867 family)